MKFPVPVPVQELAAQYGAQLFGNTGFLATGINEIHKVEPGDIAFVDAEKYYNKCLNSAASVIIIDKRVDVPSGKAILVHPNPFEVYNSIVKSYRPFNPLQQLISDTAEIDPTAILEPNVVIGDHVKIGKHTYIQSNVVIRAHTIIGDHVVIQSGTIIGTDAFYFKKHKDRYEKFCSGGRVIIENHVDIGAGCTINKGVSGDTIIGEGSILDCQVHIGHGVVLGKRCLLAAQVGIGGKTIIGDDAVLYGQVGVAQNLKIGAKAVISAKSGVSKDLEGGKSYIGYPANESMTKYREWAALRHLPEFLKNFYK
jgi:UDP-3-O-[3-hydroxymyristoyl] glucosamine N-acyltransferase